MKFNNSHLAGAALAKTLQLIDELEGNDLSQFNKYRENWINRNGNCSLAGLVLFIVEYKIKSWDKYQPEWRERQPLIALADKLAADVVSNATNGWLFHWEIPKRYTFA